jgi:hypothetical protein
MSPLRSALLLLVAASLPQAALGQVDISGEWASTFHEELPEGPQYLSQPFITSTHFKREPDGSKWMPAPCEG